MLFPLCVTLSPPFCVWQTPSHPPDLSWNITSSRKSSRPLNGLPKHSTCIVLWGPCLFEQPSPSQSCQHYLAINLPFSFTITFSASCPAHNKHSVNFLNNWMKKKKKKTIRQYQIRTSTKKINEIFFLPPQVKSKLNPDVTAAILNPPETYYQEKALWVPKKISQESAKTNKVKCSLRKGFPRERQRVLDTWDSKATPSRSGQRLLSRLSGRLFPGRPAPPPGGTPLLPPSPFPQLSGYRDPRSLLWNM